MVSIKENSLSKFIDYSLILFPIALVLGSPTVNLYLITYSLLFIYIVLKNSFYDWFKIKWIKVFIIFWLYLILTSFFATDIFNALRASFSLIRFLFFALLIGYFGFKTLKPDKIINIWFYILVFISIDIWIQFIVGYDLFGVEARFNRLSGPFGDELVVGSFIWKISSCVLPIILVQLFILNKNINKIYLYCFLLFLISVFISGERMSFLMFFSYLILSLSIMLIYKGKIKHLLISFAIFFFSLSLIATKVDIVKNRYSELFTIIKDFNASSYGKLFVSGYEIWKKNKIIGVGVKNFRVECDIQLDNREPIQHPLCSSHPHNLYLEILSETGIIGSIIFVTFILLLIKYIFKDFKTNSSEKKFKLLLFFTSLLVTIWPISTSGSFFTTWNGSYYWLIIGIILSLKNLKFNKF